MCNFLSGWINMKTEQPELADLRSHIATQEIMKWGTADLDYRREWEWTESDTGDSLKVRVLKDDPRNENWWRAILLAKWPTRDDAVQECIVIVNENGGDLNLFGWVLPVGLELPKSVSGDLDLFGCVLPDGLKLPKLVGGDLNLFGCVLPTGLKLPKSVGGYLGLSYCVLPADLKLPKSVGGNLYLNHCILAADLELPESVGGGLCLEDCKLSDGRPTKRVGNKMVACGAKELSA